MTPVFKPASRANDMAVPSCAWKPLASIRLVLLKPNPPSPRCWFDCSRTLCCAPEGAGKIQILPSVRTPSTSKRMSLILLARGLDIGAILAFESSAPTDCPFAIATQAEAALPFLSSGVSMKLLVCSAIFFLASLTAFAQTPELKFIADTLVVQADGTYDADPDLATLTFQIFAQDNDIKRAYDTATRSIQRIVEIAQRNGLAKDDIRSGVLTVSPIYEGDRKKRARSYYVQGEEVLKVRDFA